MKKTGKKGGAVRIFGFFSLIVWVIIFIALAIMFDWFGSRDIAKSTLKHGESAVEYLEKVGDETVGFFDSVEDGAEEGVNKAKDIAK